MNESARLAVASPAAAPVAPPLPRAGLHQALAAQPAAAGRTSRPTGAATGRSGSSWSCSSSACSPSSSPTTGRSSPPTRASCSSRSSSTIRRRSSAASWRRPITATRSSPRRSRRTAGSSGRRSASPTTRTTSTCRCPRPRRRPGCSPTSSASPIAERTGGTGCRDIEWNWLGTDDQGRDVVARLIYGFRISVLFGLILAGISSVIGVAGRRGAGLFRRLDRPPLPALHRDLDRDPGALPAHHHLGDHHAELLRAARHPAAVLLGLARRRGARRVPARPQLRICARRARARACPTPPSCSSTCCRTPWWRR